MYRIELSSFATFLRFEVKQAKLSAFEVYNGGCLQPVTRNWDSPFDIGNLLPLKALKGTEFDMEFYVSSENKLQVFKAVVFLCKC